MRVLITGTDRGIGAEFAKQFEYHPDVEKIYCCHLENTDCQTKGHCQHNGKFEYIKVDVTQDEDVKNLKDTLKNEPIDILINNAGIYDSKCQEFGSIDFCEALDVFKVNTLGPLRISEALLPNITKSDKKLIVSISSTQGSLAKRKDSPSYAYGPSKAALNMVMKSLQIDHPEIHVLLLHPGWVKTFIGGPEAPLEVEESVKGMIEVIQKKADEFGFYDYQGNSIPW